MPVQQPKMPENGGRMVSMNEINQLTKLAAMPLAIANLNRRLLAEKKFSSSPNTDELPVPSMNVTHDNFMNFKPKVEIDLPNVMEAVKAMAKPGY